MSGRVLRSGRGKVLTRGCQVFFLAFGKKSTSYKHSPRGGKEPNAGSKWCCDPSSAELDAPSPVSAPGNIINTEVGAYGASSRKSVIRVQHFLVPRVPQCQKQLGKDM